jgi:hypothetical protein
MELTEFEYLVMLSIGGVGFMVCFWMIGGTVDSDTPNLFLV